MPKRMKKQLHKAVASFQKGEKEFAKVEKKFAAVKQKHNYKRVQAKKKIRTIREKMGL